MLTVVPMPVDRALWQQAAQWCLNEWADAWPEDTEATYVAHYRATADDPHHLPVVLAALEDGALRGVVTLVDDDELPGATESPWLAACFVDPEHRGRGVGRALVDAAVTYAAQLGIGRLHLFTWSEESWYARLGWQVVRTVDFAGHTTSVMCRDVVQPASV